MNGQPRQWGVAPVVSTDLPEKKDHDQNAELVEELKKQNNYEAPAETQKRIAALKFLNYATLEFVKDVSRRMGRAPEEVEQYGGRVYAYGSYRLGVFGPGECLCVLKQTNPNPT